LYLKKNVCTSFNVYHHHIIPKAPQQNSNVKTKMENLRRKFLIISLRIFSEFRFLILEFLIKP